ncbi:hypothetical protein FO519_005911 [Halicephalobus sp. NKZ332]|nr:hypothetical protein FO519_005911 [Halicephalobus sp. NKZ332]
MKSIVFLFFLFGCPSLIAGDRDSFNDCMSKCYEGNNGVYDVSSFKQFADNWRQEQGWGHVKQYCSQNVYPYTHTLMSCADQCQQWDQNLSDLLLTGMNVVVDSCNDIGNYYQAQDCLSQKDASQPIFNFGEYTEICTLALDYSNYIQKWTPSCTSNDKLSMEWMNYNMEEQIAKWSIQKGWDYMTVAACSH